MKVFLFSTSVLALMIVAILCNGLYVKSITREMASGLTELPSCELSASQTLQARWEKAEKTLELSVSSSDLTEVSNRLTELCVAAAFENEEAFERARALCLDGIARIHDFERFSFLHIL